MKQKLFLTIVICISCIQLLQAQVETIKSGNWSTPSNWTVTGPPAHDDNAEVFHSMIIDTDIQVYNDSGYSSYVFYNSVHDIIGDSAYNIHVGHNGTLDFWENSQFEGRLKLSDNGKLYIRSGVTITVGGFDSNGDPAILLEDNARFVVLGTITFNALEGTIPPDVLDGPKVPTITGFNVNCWEDSTAKIVLKNLVATYPKDSVRFSLLTKPLYGTTSQFNIKNGAFNYIPNPNYNGLDSLEFSVCASRSGFTTCTSGFLKLNVRPVNDPPLAIADTFFLAQGVQEITGNVIKNDTDVDGDTLKSLYQTVLYTAKGGNVTIDLKGNIIYQKPQKFSGIDSVQYTIIDAGGAQASAYIYFIVPADIFISKGFSPNGDGVNDTWLIIPPINSPATNVSIFNRWGDLVYESQDYKSDWSGNATEGVSSNKGVPEGTYYYIVDFKEGSMVKKGFITLLR